jgi:tetratricopeptide (TPR) repeat protein
MNTTQGNPERILAGARLASERILIARAWLDENLRINPKGCRDLIEHLRPELQAADDTAGIAWLDFTRGWLAIDADDFEQAIAIIEPARLVFEDLGDREGQSRCLNALGFANHLLGIYDLALDYFRASLDLAELINRKDLACTASMNMAESLCELEEAGEALKVIQRSRMEHTVAAHNISSDHATAGRIFRALGRLEEAEWELLEAIRAAGDALHDALEARHSLAEVQIDAGRFDKAGILVAAGIEDCAQAGERLLGVRFRLSRARLLIQTGQARETIAEIEAAVRSAREIGSRKVEAEGERTLCQAWQAAEDHEKALEAFMRHAKTKDLLKSEQTTRRIHGLHEDRARREARHFENRYKQISAISEIGQRITANLDFTGTLETIYSLINGLMDAPSLVIAVMDEKRARLDYRLVMIRGERKEGFTCQLTEDTFGCWCVNHRKDIIIGNVEKDYRQYVSAYEELSIDGNIEKSLVFIPLMVGDQAVGMMSVQSHIPNAYDARKVEIIRAIGSYLAIAIMNADLYQRAVDSEKSLRQEHEALLKAREDLKQLQGVLPICASCKKIRDDAGAWHQLETYIRDNSKAVFTHGICPECQTRLYGDIRT